MSIHETIDRVEMFLSARHNRNKYNEFQRDVERELDKFRKRREWRDIIYRVYSRAEKQYGYPFKETLKIANKLEEWRRDNPGEEYNVWQVHDIIGFTIVVNYPSDIFGSAGLAQYFNAYPDELEGFYLFGGERKEQDEYFAYHFKVQGKIAKYQPFLCELQIKTALNDAWSEKTHRLIYKPLGHVDGRLKKHMTKLGVVLRLLDDQGEIIRDLIIEKWNEDKSRKAIAKQSLLAK